MATAMAAAAQNETFSRWRRSLGPHAIAVTAATCLWTLPFFLRSGLVPSVAALFSLSSLLALLLSLSFRVLSQGLFILALALILRPDSQEPLLPSLATFISSTIQAIFPFSSSPPFQGQRQSGRIAHRTIPGGRFLDERQLAVIAPLAAALLTSASGAFGSLSFVLSVLFFPVISSRASFAEAWGSTGLLAAYGAGVGLAYAGLRGLAGAHTVQFPALQRHVGQRVKATLPVATQKATVFALTAPIISLALQLLLLRRIAFGSSTNLGWWGMGLLRYGYLTGLQIACWELSAAVAEAVLTQRGPKQHPRQLALTLLSPPFFPDEDEEEESSLPSSVTSTFAGEANPRPATAVPLTPPTTPLLARTVRFSQYWAALDLCEMAEAAPLLSPAAAAAASAGAGGYRELGDDVARRAEVFASREVLESVVEACVLRIDAMTQRAKRHLSATAATTAASRSTREASRMQQERSAAGVVFTAGGGTSSTFDGAGGVRREGVLFRRRGLGERGEVVRGEANGDGLQAAPTAAAAASKTLNERVFWDLKLCEWCARAAAALTSASKLEDRFGVAQMCGCHKKVLSSLLSALLVMEQLSASSSSTPSPPSLRLLFPWSATWRSLIGSSSMTGGVNSDRATRLWGWWRILAGRGASGEYQYACGGPGAVSVDSRALAMADVLRVSLYRIVATFGDELGLLGAGGVGGEAASRGVSAVWLPEPGSPPPVFGSLDLHLSKLQTILEGCA